MDTYTYKFKYTTMPEIPCVFLDPNFKYPKKFFLWYSKETKIKACADGIGGWGLIQGGLMPENVLSSGSFGRALIKIKEVTGCASGTELNTLANTLISKGE